MTFSRQVQQLWEIRFTKVRDLERDSLYFYSGILKKYAHFLEGAEAKSILELIMKDEAKHAQIAEELLRIVKKKKSA